MRYIVFSFILLLAVVLSCESDQQDQTILPEDDYWITGNPEDHGLDAAALDIIAAEAGMLDNFNALLIVKDNTLIFEEYWNGTNANSLHQLRSITKNFTSAMVGIAVANGTIDSLDISIGNYYEGMDENHAGITLSHLLNMSSGLEWEEDTEVLDLIEGRIEDPIADILGRALEATPGERFNYNSGTTHVLSDVVSQVSSQPFDQSVRDIILKPLGIDLYDWERDAQGAVWGGFGLQLTARDQAKFGQLFLNQGRWEGEQILTQEWVTSCSMSQISVSESSTTGYSNQWWVSGREDTPLYYGVGYGGQALMILPEKNMVVVAFQDYRVTGQQSSEQWRNFIDVVFSPLLEVVQ